jgi:hypothetical protein
MSAGSESRSNHFSKSRNSASASAGSKPKPFTAEGRVATIKKSRHSLAANGMQRTGGVT